MGCCAGMLGGVEVGEEVADVGEGMADGGHFPAID